MFSLASARWPAIFRFPMLPLLAQIASKATPLEKLQNVSGQFWLKVILGAIIFGVFIFLFKKVMGMNKIILILICLVIFGVLGVNWIYNRNEPAFLTPIIDPIANSGFFPTKGTYENKQKQDPTSPGQKSSTSKAAPAGTAPAKK
ncbi:MAG: hypothetical protein QM790_16205 [Nibricoccus sp.]